MGLLSNMMFYDAIYLFKANSSNTRRKAQKLSKANHKDTKTMSNCRNTCPGTTKAPVVMNKTVSKKYRVMSSSSMRKTRFFKKKILA